MNPILQHGPERFHPSFATLKVGSRIWNFDTNRRQYKRNITGYAIGSPIFSAHFAAREIAGETKQSWLVLPYAGWPIERADKVNKKTLLSSSKGGPGTGCAWHTDETRDVLIWIHLNERKLISALENCKDLDRLKQIAALLGHKEILTEE